MQLEISVSKERKKKEMAAGFCKHTTFLASPLSPTTISLSLSPFPRRCAHKMAKSSLLDWLLSFSLSTLNPIGSPTYRSCLPPHTNIYIYKCVCVCVCVFKNIYTYTQTHIQTLIYKDKSLYMYVHMYVCMFKYLRTHTHILTHKNCYRSVVY